MITRTFATRTPAQADPVVRIAETRRNDACRPPRGSRLPVVWLGCVYAWLCTWQEWRGSRVAGHAGPPARIGESAHPGQRVSAKDPVAEHMAAGAVPVTTSQNAAERGCLVPHRSVASAMCRGKFGWRRTWRLTRRIAAMLGLPYAARVEATHPLPEGQRFITAAATALRGAATFRAPSRQVSKEPSHERGQAGPCGCVWALAFGRLFGWCAQGNHGEQVGTCGDRLAEHLTSGLSPSNPP